MFEHRNFAELEPIVVLADHAAIQPAEYNNRASAWLNRAAKMLTEKRDDAYRDGVGEENDLTFTQREIDFLIDGIERHSRKLAQDAYAITEYKGISIRPWQDGAEAASE